MRLDGRIYEIIRWEATGTALDCKKIEFTVFVLHRAVNHWRRTVPESYEILHAPDAIEGYLMLVYEALHTQGSEYLIDEVTD